MSAPAAHQAADVRAEVQELLGRSEAFRALSPEQRDSLRKDMVKVGGFLADGGWLDEPRHAHALAEDSDPVEDLKRRLADGPGQVSKDFRAGAVREGVEQFGEMVKKVDFVGFVSGLVQGVFQAVVNASIQQMQAFGELLAATAKTVDQFASDHITDAQARDHIANRYPGAARVDTSGPTPRLRPGENAGGIELGKELGLPDEPDLDDEASEQQLVTAAKLSMARQRQQLMATMVLLGINRIVVTNGLINAKVLFDMQASDSARRHAKAEMADRTDSHVGVSGFMGSIFGGFSAGHSHQTSVSSAVDDQSDARARVKAQLSGEVKLQFKSETFPLERMVDVMGLDNLNQKAAPGTAPPAVGSAARPVTR